ncbi:MAG: ATP-binding protein [Chloroflexi bacterium]|nr:ATP-binding protein [Chloroflexota bacterium]
MPIDLIAAAFELIAGQGFELAKDKAKRSERILKILDAIGLKQDAPPANDFNGVYAYTLVVYGIDKPKPILEFFRHQFIKNAFRKSFETRDLSYLEEESESFIDWSPIAKELLSIFHYDPRREFAEFREQFITAAKLTRTVHEVLVDQELEDISDGIRELPTKNELRTGLSPINQKLEELTGKEKRLDGEQLKAIANQSLDRHRERFSFSKADEKAREIPRDIHTTIVESLLQSSKPIIGIMGPSGIGKSTLLRQIGRDINSNNGGIALWIPAEDIPSATSVDELLHNVLHRYDATLSTDVSFDALELSSHTNKGLLLLVDDVNRAAKPDQILSSISALSANAAAKDTKIHFVVPLWQGQIAVSPDSREAEKHWEIINLAYFSEAESKEYSRLISPEKISNTQQLIASLGGDPFLVGLATEEFGEISSKESIDLLNGIFKYTIDEAIRKARAESNELATVKDFNDAIDLLIELMLAAETPEPMWESIKVHLGTEKAKLILALAQVNRLGWIDISIDMEIWRWKHTRLRDVIIGRWLAKNVLLSFEVSDQSKANDHILTDPGLAEAFALALVFLPENVREKALAVLCKYQLLSLVEILQLNLFSRDNKLGVMLAKTLNHALINYDGKTQEFVDSPESVIFYKLSWITNPLVLDVTDGLPKNWSWSVARLRNGDLSSGMLAIANYARSHEFLMGRFPFLEQAIKDFEQIHIGNKIEVVNSLVKDLLNPKRLNAVFYIASILKWSELVEPLWDAWVNLSQESKLRSLAGMVWFLSGYEDSSIILKLESALLMSLEINNVPKSEGLGSERLHSFTDPLRLALSQPISSTAAHVWAKTISENQELSNSIGYLLGGIDHPETLDIYVHLEQRWFGVWHETSESIDPMSDGLRDENRVKSEETRKRLWEIILKEKDQATRRRSLGFWGKAAKSHDLPQLQSIRFDDPIFENVLRLRLRLKDKTTSSILIERINKNPNEWIRFASLVPYEPGVFDAVLTNLEKIPPEHGFYMVNSIFYRLPKEQVKQIVFAKEKLLLNSHEVWSALWLSGEENAIKLVVKAIKQVKQDEIGKLDHFFPLGVPTAVTQKMLDALLPVISYFPIDSLKWLAELTLRNGFEQWAIDHLGDTLKGVELRTFEWVYVENIINTLSDVAQYVPEGFDAVIKKSNLFGLEISYEHRNKYEYTANPVDAVKIWLKNSTNLNSFIISARIVSKYGSVNDIDWWLSQKPNDEKATSVWNYALYHLKRRRWQIA